MGPGFTMSTAMIAFKTVSLNYDNKKGSLLVVGDFNSCTGTLSDIEDVNENFAQVCQPMF